MDNFNIKCLIYKNTLFLFLFLLVGCNESKGSDLKIPASDKKALIALLLKNGDLFKGYTTDKDINDLYEVTLEDATDEDIRLISYLTNLEVITATFGKFTSLKPLAKLPKLTGLEIQRGIYSDISPLKNLKNLKDSILAAQKSQIFQF